MTTRILTTCAVLALLLGALPAQNEAAAEAISGLKAAFKEKIPDEIKTFLDRSAEAFNDADDKQKNEILKLAKKGIKNREREVRAHTVVTLGKLKGGKKDKWGSKSTGLLAGMVKDKRVQKDLDMFDKVCRAIGAVGNKKGIPVLTKLLKYKEFAIVAAAAESLAGYKDYAVKDKKDIVSEILKMYTSVASQARDPKNATARRRLGIIEKSMEMSLKALTGQKVFGANAWRKWWNNTGKKAKSWTA